MDIVREKWTWRATAGLQGLLAVAVLATLVFAPPVHGRTLLIPIAGESVSTGLLDRAMLTRIADGPLPGSVVVEGKGRELAGEMFRHGIIMLAAPTALCGVNPQEGEA